MRQMVDSLLGDERGAIQVEYAVMASLIAAAAALGLGALGDAMDQMYEPVVRSGAGAQAHPMPAAFGS